MKFLLCGLSLLLAGCVTVPDDPITRNNNAVTASVGVQDLKYGEAIGDTETGAMRAAALSYSVDSGVVMIDITAKYAHSTDETYNGFLIGSGAPISGTHPSTTEDAAVRFGGLIPVGGHFQWGMLAQADYHFWNRDSTNNAHGYDEKYRHLDVGGALLFQWWTGPVVFSVSPTVLFMVDPYMTASDIPGAPGFKHAFDLQSTVGAALDFKTSLNVTRHQSLVLDLNATYFYYYESNPYAGLLEPDSHTYIPTVLLGYSILL